MANKFPLFDEDMDIIQKLGDTPGSDDNLDGKQLQAKFDEGGNKLKVYLNKIIAELNSVLGSEGAFISGGNLLGNINANTNRILGLMEPKKNDEAATKNYVDTTISKIEDDKIDKTGGTLSGNLDMGGNTIQNLKKPVSSADAATKQYVDERILVFDGVKVPSSSWETGSIYTNEGFPYYANVTLSGAEKNMVPQVVFAEKDKKDFVFCGSCTSAIGFVQVYAETKPDREIELSTVTLFNL